MQYGITVKIVSLKYNIFIKKFNVPSKKQDLKKILIYYVLF